MLNTLKPQLIGTLKIAAWTMCIYYIIGTSHISSVYWRGFVALLLGLFIAYILYAQTKTLANNLQFEPEGPCKTAFDLAIKECQLDPAKIRLRYGYSNESIALCMFNTVSIDPMSWTECAQDISMDKAREVIKTHIFPSISAEQKETIDFIKGTMTAESQNFVFKHELGHVANNYSYKKILLTGAVMTTAVFAGTTLVAILMPYLPSFVAALLGILAGAITDLLLSYGVNMFFKYKQEKSADMFAVQYCNPDEINAAAIFFERHQDFINAQMANKGVTNYGLTKYLNGQLDGKERAIFLRAKAQQKG